MSEVESVAHEANSFAAGAKKVGFDPIQWLIQKGLGFLISHVKPIQDAIHVVTGDPDALKEGAKSYQEISKSLHELAEDLHGTLERGLVNWEGEAAKAAKEKLDKFVEGVHGTGAEARNLATLLEASSALMEAAVDVIKGLLADLIEWLIITWLAAQAAAIPSLGASEVAAAGATAVEVGTTTARVAKVVHRILELVERIGKAIEEVLSKIKVLKGPIGKIGAKFGGTADKMREWGNLGAKSTELGKDLRNAPLDELKKVPTNVGKGLIEPGINAAQDEMQHHTQSGHTVDQELNI
jgi:uncharacterized protein YukE